MIPYVVKTFRGGISDESDKGVEGAFKFGYGLEIHDRDDVLKCNSTMATIEETTVTDLIKWFVPASDGSTYCFGSAGSIYARSGDGTWSFVYNDENGNIKGAAEWELSDGNNYLFWATNTSVARVILNGSLDVPWAAGVATQDWKTTLDAAEWHTMKQASGDLMIANGNFLAKIDYSGNFTPSALNIRPGNLIKCFEEKDDYVVLGSYRTGEIEEGHIWSWIVTANNWIQKKRIPVKGVNSMINTEFFMLQGGADGELFYSDFVNSVPIHGIYGGGETSPAGVSIEDDLAVFGVYGGDYPGIWSYGRKRKNRPYALNYEYRLAKTIAGSTVTEIGAVENVNGELLASWKTTDGSTVDYGVDSVSSTTKASAVYEGLEFDAGAPYAKKTFNTVKLNMSPMPASTSVSVKFKTDKESAWRYAVTGAGATSYSETDSVEAVFSIGKTGYIYEVGVELTPNVADSPEVLSVSTYLSDEKNAY